METLTVRDGGELYRALRRARPGTTILLAPGDYGATLRFCTLFQPKRWALRILQETREPGFVPSRNGVMEDCLIVFRGDSWSEGGVNLGPGTAPETFRFARNHWFCVDRPERSRPRLPSPERDGVYGRDPQLGDDLRPRPGSPAATVGAEAFR